MRSVIMIDAIVKGMMPITSDSPVSSYLQDRHLDKVIKLKGLNLGWNYLNYYCEHTRINHLLPTIIAPFTIGQSLKGIHRTFVDVSRLIIHKGKDKRMKGNMAGSAVRLWSGSSNIILVTEGIEDALSYWICRFSLNEDVNVWAAGSSGGIKRLELPLWRSAEVFIGADMDKAGIAAANHLYGRIKDNGWIAHIEPPFRNNDWNEYLSHSIELEREVL